MLLESPLQNLAMVADSGGGFFSTQTLLFIGIVFFAFYFLILRPQKAEQRKREEALNQLNRGDKVVTAGGIHGVLVNVSGKETVEVEVAKNVRLTVNRTSISVVDSPARAAEKAKLANEKQAAPAANSEKGSSEVVEAPSSKAKAGAATK